LSKHNYIAGIIKKHGNNENRKREEIIAYWLRKRNRAKNRKAYCVKRQNRNAF